MWLPKPITVDNGPKFAGKALDEWAYGQGLRLSFCSQVSHSRTPTSKAFNGKFRDHDRTYMA